MALVSLTPETLADIFFRVLSCGVERAGQVSHIVVTVACVNRLFAAVFRALAMQRAPEMRLLVAPNIAAMRIAFIEQFMRDVFLHSNDAPNISAELRMGRCVIAAVEGRPYYGFISVIISTRRLTDAEDQDLSIETMRFAIPIPLLLPHYIAYACGRQHAAAQRICLTACDNNTRHVLFTSV
jgi:hypothetical protein